MTGALRGHWSTWAPFLCALALGATEPAAAQSPPPHRFYRHYAQDDGLPSSVVFALAQDPDGTLWIGTAGGLARYGGRDFVTVRPDLFGGGVHDIAASRSGRIAVVERGRRELWLGAGGHFAGVRGPDGEPQRSILRVRFDAGDTLWVVHENGTVERHSPDGRWLAHPSRFAFVDTTSGDGSNARVDDVFAQPDGEFLVATRSAGGRAALWRLRAGALERAPFEGRDRIAAAAHATDGALWVATHGADAASIYRIGADSRLVATRPGRPFALGRRGDAVFIADAFGLEVFATDGSAERIRTSADMGSGGPLLIDREGSVWLGTAHGLVQIPEPETSTWDENHGLPGSHGEFVAVSSDGVWYSTWQGLGLLERPNGGWRGWDAAAYSAAGATRLCVDGEGRLWLQAQSADRATEVLGSVTRRVFRRHGRGKRAMDCDTTESGDVLIVAGDTVHRVRPGGTLVGLGVLPAPESGGRTLIAGGPDGEIHIVREPHACRSTVRALEQRGASSWRCERLPDIGETRDLAVVRGPAGEPEVWLASFSGGVWRRSADGWRPVDDLLALEQRATNGLMRSPNEGMWVFGFGFVLRLAPIQDRWQIVEQIGGWQGVDGDVRGLWEEPDGTVWLASWRGLTRVPASARFRLRVAPRTRLVALRVDGEPRPADAVRIPADHRAVEIEFAAGALRDPHRVRYRTRLDDVGWTVSREPVFRVAALRPGRHALEAAASLDGRLWGESIHLEVRVEPPWYARASILALSGALLIALGFGAHRLRVSHVVGLEEERTRIAMDLHDELGAGLGSLGILGGLVARNGVPAGAQLRIGEQIARSAAELGESLHDIVYALRTGEARMEHLGNQLAARARTLFADADVACTTRFLHAPGDTLAPGVGRHAYRLGVEALHNAARHADSKHVEIGLAQTPTGRLRLWIHDDGHGIDARTLAEPGGMGLVTMRRRAGAIGGDLTIASEPGGGTRVELVFDPNGRPPAKRWTALRHRHNGRR